MNTFKRQYAHVLKVGSIWYSKRYPTDDFNDLLL